MPFELHQHAGVAAPAAGRTGQGGQQQVVDLGPVGRRGFLQQLPGTLGVQGQDELALMAVFQGSVRVFAWQRMRSVVQLRLPVVEFVQARAGLFVQVPAPGLVGTATRPEIGVEVGIETLQVFQQDDQQQALAAVGHVHQQRTQQRPLFEVEAALGFFAKRQQRLLGPRLPAPQRLAGLLGVGLVPGAALFAETQAQGIVLRLQAFQGTPQPVAVERLARLQQERLVPVLAVGNRPLEEPALYRRQRHLAACRPLFRRRRTRLGRQGQAADVLVLEQVARAQLQSGLARTADYLDRDDRVAAEAEEVVVQADPLDAQQILPDFRQGSLHCVARCAVACLRHAYFRRRQRLAIQLAVRTQRHPLQRQPLRRHHVFRQARRQVRGQRFAPVAALALQHHVADQLLAVHRQHRRLAHPRMLQQARLDLAQLDAQAAQLHLVVDPPGVLDHPVGAVARQVAGAVHPFPSHERAGDETLGSQPRTLVVATGQAPTGQVQLAEHAHRYRLQVAIEDVAGQVGDRPADRHRVLALLHAGPVGDVDGRLGRAIEVIKAGLRQLGEHLLLGVRRQRLAAANDAFQAGAGGDVFILQERLQHRRHEVQRVDPFAVDQRHQLRRVAMVARRGHHQTCSAHQRPEELPDRHVEAERGLLQHRVADAQPIGLLHPAQAVAQRRMAVAGALGLTGGTGGVDDIGEVLAIEMNIRVRLTVILEPGRTAIQVDPLHALRQRQLQVRLAEQQLHTAVLQHVGLALLGILRVHRHVGAAGLEDRHQGHDHLDGALHGHAHQAVRADPALDQGMRQAVGPAVQLGVVQAFLAEGQRRRRRRALDLLLEQPVHAALQRVLGSSGVPAFQQLATLLASSIGSESTLACGFSSMPRSRFCQCRAMRSTVRASNRSVA